MTRPFLAIAATAATAIVALSIAVIALLMALASDDEQVLDHRHDPRELAQFYASDDHYHDQPDP